MSDVIAELKRRKIFQISAMYLMAAWLVIQVGSVVFSPLGMPEGSMRVLIISCVAGFPIAIALGWVFDWTSQGIVRTASKTQRPRKRSANYPLILGSIVSLLFVALGYGGYRGYDFWSKVQWAQTVAQPTLTKHIEVNDFAAAFNVASEIEEALGPTPALDSVWDLISAEVSFTSEPSGATVSYRRYDQPDGPWQVLGSTPIDTTRVASAPTVWRIEKSGYQTHTFARIPHTSDEYRIWPSHYKLNQENTAPPNTVTVEAQSQAFVSLGALSLDKSFNIGRFHIDKTEVSNKEYQEFVNAGGYEEEKYWTEAFVDGESNLSFAKAMQRLTDSTGRAGPATWIASRYPEGKADHPVSGVSWYEAAAYAKFRGRHLPTIYHWSYAALTDTELLKPMAPIMASQSNLEGEGTVPVGSTNGVSAAGAKDMFGNVAEWVWNKRNNDRHYTLGLGWSDPAYNASLTSHASSWDRLPTQGFRLVTYDSGEVDDTLTQGFSVSTIQAEKITPISDEVYELLVTPHAKTALPIRAKEETVELPNGFMAMRVEIDYPSTDEKLPLYLLMPENAKPPYQTLIWFGGQNALISKDNNSLYQLDMKAVKFLQQSGRMIAMPIWTNTFERNTRGLGPKSLQSDTTGRELVIKWRKDFSFVIDYLQARDDVASDKIGLVALSMGALISPYLLAKEERIKNITFWSAGFAEYGDESYQRANILAGALQRIAQPTLMINGQHDYVIPLDSQKILFDFLGTNEEDKKHVVFDAGHYGWPIGEFVRENLDWLDKYLGPVKK